MSATLDRLYLGPALSRVPNWELVHVLTESRRVLRQGGILRVAAYDLEAALQAYRCGNERFFWDHTWASLAGQLGVQLTEWGQAGVVLTASLIDEALRASGFDHVEPRAFGLSRDPYLSAPDRLPDHCCFVEAENPVAWPIAGGADGAPRGIHLSLANPEGGRFNVVWHAQGGRSGTLRYRAVDECDWSETSASQRLTIDGPDAPRVYCATTDELKSGHEYEYEVVQTTSTATTFRWRGSMQALPADQRASIRLAFVADTGIANREDGLCDGVERVIGELCAMRPHVVLGGGDYCYRASDNRFQTGQQAVRAWVEQMEPLASRAPLMVQFGNHEVALGEYLRDWETHFPTMMHQSELDVRSLSFEAGPCHVVGFYAPTEDIDLVELSWLWSDLIAARERGVPWIVMYQHQPLIANGTSHPSNAAVSRALAPVLARFRVDLHLSAHDQNYERTAPLVWAGGDPSVLQPRQRNRYTKGEGVILAKVSPGGKRSDRGKNFSLLPPIPQPPVVVADDNAHHFALIEADSRTLRVAVYGIAGSEEELVVVDEFVVESCVT